MKGYESTAYVGKTQTENGTDFANSTAYFTVYCIFLPPNKTLTIAHVYLLHKEKSPSSARSMARCKMWLRGTTAGLLLACTASRAALRGGGGFIERVHCGGVHCGKAGVGGETIFGKRPGRCISPVTSGRVVGEADRRHLTSHQWTSSGSRADRRHLTSHQWTSSG